MTVVSGGDRTDEWAEAIENAARAMFEDGLDLPGDYTWDQMVSEDHSRADIWRADARRVLAASGLVSEVESLRARVEAAEAEPRKPDDGWTPSTEQVRAHYVFDQTDTWDRNRGLAFDRWLAARDARIRREALEEAADAADGFEFRDEAWAGDWLRDRAREEVITDA